MLSMGPFTVDECTEFYSFWLSMNLPYSHRIVCGLIVMKTISENSEVSARNLHDQVVSSKTCQFPLKTRPLHIVGSKRGNLNCILSTLIVDICLFPMIMTLE